MPICKFLQIVRMAENGDNEKMAALEAKICHQIEVWFLWYYNVKTDSLRGDLGP